MRGISWWVKINKKIVNSTHSKIDLVSHVKKQPESFCYWSVLLGASGKSKHGHSHSKSQIGSQIHNNSQVKKNETGIYLNISCYGNFYKFPFFVKIASTKTFPKWGGKHLYYERVHIYDQISQKLIFANLQIL